MLGKPIIQIPGKSIRPPDDNKGKRCPNCRRVVIFPRKEKDPVSKRVKFVCPFCGHAL